VPTETGHRKNLVPLGLHSLFACLRTINPAVVFFSVTLFAITPAFIVLFFQNHNSIHPQAKKKSGTPTATTVPEMR